MKKVVALCLIAMSAFAGERMLGIVSNINSATSNLSQNPDAAAFFWDGGYTQPFCIPERSLVTLVCNDNSYICTDSTTCNATIGLPLPASTIFPTSVGLAKGAIDQQGLADAGLGAGGGRTIRCAAISVISQVTDAGYHGCSVWERMGNE